MVEPFVPQPKAVIDTGKDLRQTAEGEVFQLLRNEGYSATEAWWIVKNLMPPTFHLQTIDQMDTWLESMGVDFAYDRLIEQYPQLADMPREQALKTLKTEELEYPDFEGMSSAEIQAASAAYAKALKEEKEADLYGQWVDYFQRSQAASALLRQETVGMMAAQGMATIRGTPATESAAQVAADLQRAAEVERQRQIAARFGELAPMMPSREEAAAPFIEQARGVSPAFQEMAQRRFLPDILQELGMPQKRRQWWETGTRQIAEQLLPETEQAKELMALRRTDPWTQLLSQPTFLQQLENRYRSLGPAERGTGTARFRPRTRFVQ